MKVSVVGTGYVGLVTGTCFAEMGNSVWCAGALILITEWKEFRSPDFYEIARVLKTPVIFDGRNQYDAKRVAEYGIEYHQIGVRTAEVTA